MTLHLDGKADEAIDRLKQLAADVPDYALTFNALAAFAKQRGELDEAIRYIKEYCQLEPNDPFGFTILSSYCIAAGNRGDAEIALGQAYELRMRQQFEM